ncbi:hypothetical protein FA95DRAFT_1612438 [Auriscalpium vulgare]|uniref:Uncharacterized protein n=1 Tax=Auriscalpium vulgare TaxID=40419 RepID=A0ACB8R7S2_9AGAM|nr:hypothetical protein FA95DRAFT_1612438 [Auriscalpium vulgare]
MAIEVPLDVYSLIIEWAFRSSQHARSINPSTLRACALVCRAWTPIAQRLLFRRICCTCTNWHGPKCKIRLLVNTLSIRPNLAAHVRHMTVASQPSKHANVCLRLLELCRHVEGIFFLDWADNSTDTGAELNARLRAMQLRPVLLEVVATESSANGVLEALPAVRVLTLRAAHVDSPLPPTIEALKIHGHNAGECLLRSTPLPALRYLSVIAPLWSDTAICPQLISTGILPQLESLQVKGRFPPPQTLEQLVRLRTLVVDQLPEEPTKLLPSLRHFGYHSWTQYLSGQRAEHAKLAVDLISELPELRLVTATRDVAQDVRAALEGMCREEGVEFGTYAMPNHFWKPWNIDWI